MNLISDIALFPVPCGQDLQNLFRRCDPFKRMISMPEIPSGSNVVGLGIDTIEVSRIRDSIENHGDHFLNKIFTAEEKIIPSQKQILLLFMPPVLRPRKHGAKAFKTGIGKEFGWLDSEIVRGEEGEPFIKLSEVGMKRLEKMGGSKIARASPRLSTPRFSGCYYYQRMNNLPIDPIFSCEEAPLNRLFCWRSGKSGK